MLPCRSAAVKNFAKTLGTPTIMVGSTAARSAASRVTSGTKTPSHAVLDAHESDHPGECVGEWKDRQDVRTVKSGQSRPPIRCESTRAQPRSDAYGDRQAIVRRPHESEC